MSTKCIHGKLFAERCLECELISLRDEIDLLRNELAASQEKEKFWLNQCSKIMIDTIRHGEKIMAHTLQALK